MFHFLRGAGTRMIREYYSATWEIERADLLSKIEAAVFSQIGRAYIWAGQSPLVGFDCSGFIVWLLRSFGVIRSNEDYNAALLYSKFKTLHRAEPGALVYYGRGSITHCMYCLNDLWCIGASGGDKNCLTYNDAVIKDAYVKILPINYREDIIGYNQPFNALYKQRAISLPEDENNA